MKTSIEHLPEDKQKDINKILSVILEIADPEKVILFGSHARGDWVTDQYEEKGVVFSYESDYDFLVIIKKDGRKENEVSHQIESFSYDIKGDVSSLVHDIEYVNVGLSQGQYFFTEIIHEGVLLYDTNKFAFDKIKQLTLQEQKENADEFYRGWCASGMRFLRYAISAFELAEKNEDPLNEVVFLLHQASERFYGGLLLIFLGYKPKTHKLNVYRKYSKTISSELNEIFLYPPEDSTEHRLFNLLKLGYLNSRYQSDYSVNKKDVKALIGKVKQLEKVVVKLCLEKISSLG